MKRRFGRQVTRALALTLACALTPACATAVGETARPMVILEQPGPEWRGIIQPGDLDRIERLGDAWRQSLETARRAGFGRRIRREGALFEPASTLRRPAPAPGAYRCRVFRLGGERRSRRGLSVSGPFFCFVGADGALLSFTRQTGGERPGGYLYDDNDTRQVFIGAEARQREQIPPAYATDAGRDVVGVMERVGDFRYRLVVPWPRGAMLEIYELVPALG